VNKNSNYIITFESLKVDLIGTYPSSSLLSALSNVSFEMYVLLYALGI